jgi:6-pyruvoyl-tetrahydropterin synthase
MTSASFDLSQIKKVLNEIENKLDEYEIVDEEEENESSEIHEKQGLNTESIDENDSEQTIDQKCTFEWLSERLKDFYQSNGIYWHKTKGSKSGKQRRNYLSIINSKPDF